MKECVLTWGDLGVEPERVPAQAVVEESAEAVVAFGEGPNEKECLLCEDVSGTASDARPRPGRLDRGKVKPCSIVAQRGSQSPASCRSSHRATSTSRTAWCGPACQVVWEGSVPKGTAPIPIVENSLSLRGVY